MNDSQSNLETTLATSRHKNPADRFRNTSIETETATPKATPAVNHNQAADTESEVNRNSGNPPVAAENPKGSFKRRCKETRQHTRQRLHVSH